MTDKRLLICPNCHRSNIRYRFKKKEFVCNLCASTWSKIPPLKSPENTPLTHPAHPNKPSNRPATAA